MSATATSAPDATTVDVRRALGVPTRAGIYRRLRTEGTPCSAREVAEMFGLHPNVARTHLDTLADAGLVVTGRRKHPGGGRPAKVYVAKEQATGERAPTVPAGSHLAVATLASLLGSEDDAVERLEAAAEAQGRRLVLAAGGRAETRELDAALVVAVEALRAAFPEVRLGDDTETPPIEGLEVGLRLIGEADAALGDAFARGLVRGAVAAAGGSVRVESLDGRVRVLPSASDRTPTVGGQVDARGQTYQAGVVATMRAIMGIRPGEHLEVLTDTQGAPAAFARWADRAGHQVVDVARIRDLQGQEAVRLVLRRSVAS